MPRTAKRVDSPRPRKTASTRKNQARPHETPTCDETGAATGMYSILIVQALLDAYAFTEAQAVTVEELQKTTGITVEEIQFLACQLAAPGFAVLEGPTPVGSESEIESLYIETDVDKLLSFALSLANKGIWAHGRSAMYAKHYEAMRNAKHPWATGDPSTGSLLTTDRPRGA